MERKVKIALLLTALLLLVAGCQKDAMKTTEGESTSGMAQETEGGNVQETEEVPVVYSGEGREDCCLFEVLSGNASIFWETEGGIYTVKTLRTEGEGSSETELNRETINNNANVSDESAPGTLLYYLDKDRNTWKIVCHKEADGVPCDHKGIYCDGVVSEQDVSIGLYDNHIYSVSFLGAEPGTMLLCRRNLDGSQEEVARILSYPEGQTTGGMYHRGNYIYYFYESDVETGQIRKETIYVCSLTSQEEETLILEDTKEDLYGYRIYPYEDFIYLLRYGKNGNQLIQYDIKQKEQQIVAEGIPDGTLYPAENRIYISAAGEGVYCLDLENKEVNLIFEQSEGETGIAYFDGDYFYSGLHILRHARAEDRLRIYNQEGKLVEELSYPEEEAEVFRNDKDVTVLRPSSLYYAVSTENMVFFKKDQLGALPEWYLEKDKIGTAQLEWIKMGDAL